jgi:CheY-like chemotaxis protein
MTTGSNPGPAKHRLLLVDDDEGVLEMMQARLLATLRFEVSTTTRAKDALARLAEFRPDLVVSDIDMPGMDGGAFAAALRERRAMERTPIVFLSSMVSASESDSSGGHIGGWPMVSKKARFEDILAVIDRLLATKS